MMANYTLTYSELRAHELLTRGAFFTTYPDADSGVAAIRKSADEIIVLAEKIKSERQVATLNAVSKGIL